LPEVGVHLACGLASVPHVDYVSWLREVFTNGAVIESGKMKPGADAGLGVAGNEEAAAKWRVGEHSA
jgi:L-alanine-DL-glutamate epimerase-like enolase superfamily enzyme